MSFDRCLLVIAESAKQLSATPEIEEKTDNIRIAKFKMSDGVLFIKCDGVNNQFIVSMDKWTLKLAASKFIQLKKFHFETLKIV